MQEKLEQFIKDNGLQFVEGRRNSDAVVISGYALHLGVSDLSDIENAIDSVFPEVSNSDCYEDELKRVFEYAESNNYGAWWSKSEAKKTYKF